MRSLRPSAARRLRTSLTSESLVSSPFHTRQSAIPYLLCAYHTPPQISSRAFQSSSAAPSNVKETPFNTQPTQTTAQQTAPQTHYAFFPRTLPKGSPPAGPFDIDPLSLKREFLQLQARAHPDLHPQADKKRAEALSSRINEAYKTLQNPLLRAQYLLSMRGIDTAEDETAKVDDPELLMEVLEARETIEAAEYEDELIPLKQDNGVRIRKSERVIEEAFKRDDLQTAKEEAVKLRYWVNIEESIDNWEKGVPVVLQH